MHTAWTVIYSIFWTIVLFSILIVLHEGGHYLSARMFGVRVPEFMVGLPGPNVSFRAKGTKFGITAIPLGGYAKIAGMEPGPEDPLLAQALGELALSQKGLTGDELGAAVSEDTDRGYELGEILYGWDVCDREKVGKDIYRYRIYNRWRDYPSDVARLDEARKGTYRALSLPKRLTVLLSGIFVNLVTMVLIFVVVLSIWGITRPSPKLDAVVKDGPAATAGIQAGDTVTSIDGKKIDTWDDITAAVSGLKPGETVKVTVERNGAPQEYDVTVKGDSQNGKTPVLGIEAGTENYRPSVGESFAEAGKNVELTANAVFGLLNPAKFKQTTEMSSSIVGITVITGEVAKQGALAFTTLIAAISLSLGLVNLLPIPPLDGGKVVIEIAQKISRREFGYKVQNTISLIGMSLLMVFFVYMVYLDISRLV